MSHFLHHRRLLVVAAVFICILSVAGIVFGRLLMVRANPCGTVTDAVASKIQDLTMNGDPVMGIAHNVNSGKNEVHRALGCGAAAVELDVVDAGGQLRVSHGQPGASDAGKQPLLEDMWSIADKAPTIALDIKQPTPDLMNKLITFLEEPGRGEADVVITTDDIAVLKTLHGHAPEIRRFLTVETPQQLRALRDNPTFVKAIQGVSIEDALVDQQTVDWLHSQHLRVWVWSVMDPLRARDLVALGVDGITTDNLALLDMLRSLDDDGS